MRLEAKKKHPQKKQKKKNPHKTTTITNKNKSTFFFKYSVEPKYRACQIKS